MKINRIVSTWALALLSVFAVFPSVNLQAQTNADIARNAFAVTVTVNINNFTETPVTIPAGKRLVVENVSLSGAAQATPYVQPIVVLSAAFGGGTANNYYFGPNPSVTDPTQYYASMPTTIYADALEVSPAYAGYTPSFMQLSVIITGYLVDLPK